jgi:hypothetical protein
VLRVSPKSRSKYVYRGKGWVDGTDVAVTRFEGEPTQNPRSGRRGAKFITNTRRSRASGFRIGMNRQLHPAGRTHHPDHRVQGLSRDRCPRARRSADRVVIGR